jgi:cell shape-determining protein MreC
MIYLRNNRKNSWQKNKSTISLVVIALVMVGLFFFFKSSLQSYAFTVFSPLLRAYNSTLQSIKLGGKYFVPDFRLERENRELSQEVQRLQQEVFDLRAAELENDELRNRLQMKKDNLLSAAVLLSPPRTPYDTLIIDRGEYDGVQRQARIILGDRVALGVVENVSANQSTVRLLSAPGSRTETVIERTGAIVELEGVGGGNFKLELPLGSDILKGDLLVMSGLPRRVAAQVVEVRSDDATSFLHIYLQLPSPLLGNSPLYVEIY